MALRFVVGLGVVLLLLIGGGLLLGVYFLNKSIPEYEGSEHVSNITAAIQIDRDEHAIPHISAHTDADAYYALGFVHAQDRLFQMEFTRRIGQGRLSEMFGKKTYLLDAWSRTIGFARIAEEMWKKASPKTQQLLTAYSNGVNNYIENHRSNLGFEFDAMNAQPEKWRPQDCLLIGRLMAWEMNFAYWNDAAFSDIALKLDSVHLQSLFPDYPENGTTIIEGLGTTSSASSKAASAITTQPKLTTPTQTPVQGSSTIKPRTTVPKAPAQQHAQPQSRPQQQRSIQPSAPPRPRPVVPRPVGENAKGVLREYFANLRVLDNIVSGITGNHATGGGSNTMAVAPSKTATGGAILENDMHLALSAPSRWFLVHIKSDEGLNVAGFNVPGLPAFVSGRNPDLSWGVTNGMIDESDFFIEKLDSTGTKYLTTHGPQKFVEIIDSIRVKDTTGYNPSITVALPIRLTQHGPIISDIHPFRIAKAFHNNDKAGAIPYDSTRFEKRGSNVQLALTWNGLYALTDEIGCFFTLHKSKTIAEARAATRPFATPCLNLSLADTRGNIAYQLIGRIPKRNGNEHRILLPREGDNPNDQWLGFISGAELPSLENPSRGYIVTANNPAIRTRTIPHSNNWEPQARSQRISELLEQRSKIDTAYIKQVALDITSTFDRDVLLPKLLVLYPDPNPTSIKPDSSSALRLDSMRRAWKRDSIRKSSLTDSMIKQLVEKDSLSSLSIHPTDTTTYPKVDRVTEQALEYLRNWDGGMREEEIAPTIYAVFLQQLLINTFRDELGEDRFRQFIYIANVPIRTLEKILSDSNNVWWDDVGTRGFVESRDTIIKISFQQAITILRRTFKDNLVVWQWGKLHTLTYRHIFESGGEQVARLVNIDAGPVPGGATTVMQATYYLWAPYEMKIGPSMRMIADMKTSSLYAALPTGNASAVFSDYYRDMVEMFKKGDFVTIPLFETKSNWRRYELLPK